MPYLVMYTEFTFARINTPLCLPEEEVMASLSLAGAVVTSTLSGVVITTAVVLDGGRVVGAFVVVSIVVVSIVVVLTVVLLTFDTTAGKVVTGKGASVV